MAAREDARIRGGMIETTMGQRMEAERTIAHLAEVKLPVREAYDFAKLVKLIRAELQHAEEQRNAFIRELGTERPATDTERAQGQVGPLFNVSTEHLPEF